MWLFHSSIDKVGDRANNCREFPFDASATDKELYFKGYGIGSKTTAKLTAKLPPASLFTVDTINKFNTPAEFKPKDSIYKDKAGEASQPTNMVMFKFTAGNWGGSCCKKPAECPEVTSIRTCDLGDGSDVKLFATNQNKQIAHQFFNSKGGADKINALSSIAFTKLFD
jgi:hypothetical protein